MRTNWLAGLCMAVALLGTFAPTCDASVSFFSDDFESGLSQWAPNLSGQIVLDPLGGSNKVLHFTLQGSGGDIFSAQPITTASTYTLSFDYLGLVPHPGGGFVGVQVAPGPGSVPEMWIAGDFAAYPALVDISEPDSLWHHYQITFTSTIGNSVYLKLEDFVGSDSGFVGNAYFDNVVLSDSSLVPEPASLIVWSLLGIAGVVAFRQRRKAS